MPTRSRGDPACLWLRRASTHSGRGREVFLFEPGIATARGGSYAGAGRALFRPARDSLWLVAEFVRQGVDRSGSSASMRRFTFDVSEAEQQIDLLRQRLSARLLMSGALGDEARAEWQQAVTAAEDSEAAI